MWHGPQLHNRHDEQSERTTLQRRTDDLFANDWAARSGIDAIANNSIGTGLAPQSRPSAEMLGLSLEEARTLARNMERIWALWTHEAHYSGMLHFADLQYLGMRTLLKSGEMLHIPVMLSEKERLNRGRSFSLCLQNIAPQRLVTPSDLETSPHIHDGVHLSPTGLPLGYYVALPSYGAATGTLTSSTAAPLSSECAYISTRKGHRPNIFHIFRHDTDEQVRGVSPLATGIKLVRHLTDALDYELYAQVIAASFPVFFATEHPPTGAYPGLENNADDDASHMEHTPIEAGTMLYGAPGEKPEILESKRPSSNFCSFVEIIMRAMSASIGIPYESLSKDFSKTNYSSARAALNEAWKLYQFYRSWFARMYCQPIYEMVMEEAYLRGMLTLPSHAKGFYEARRLWCADSWVGPARGFVDPVKEINATVTALENRIMTYDEAWKERGGDFDESLAVMQDEQARMANLLPNTSTKATARNGDAHVDAEEKE